MMRLVLAVARRELTIYLRSPIALTLAAAFLVIPERLAAWNLDSDAMVPDLRGLLVDLAAGATPPPLLVADPAAIDALRAEIRLR